MSFSGPKSESVPLDADLAARHMSPLASFPEMVPFATTADAVAPLLLLLRWHSFGQKRKKRRSEAFEQPRAKLDPEAWALRSEKGTAAEPREDHGDGDGFLPGH